MFNKNITKNSIGDINNVGSVDIGDKTIINIILPSPKKIQKELTEFIPRIEKDKIVGRESELVDLRKRLFDNKQVLLVNGLGGIGKTTIAQAYMSEYWDDYEHVAWVEINNDNIAIDFVNTEGLCSRLDIDTDGNNTETLFYDILRKLKDINSTKPSLLIMDNAKQELYKWYDYLPKQPNWHILVTSRNYIEKFNTKELGFLSEEDAIKLFLLNYKDSDICIDDIKKVVKLVDYHTLTIEILAKTAKRKQIGLEELEKAIEKDLESKVYIEHNRDKIVRIKSYLISIFNISVLNNDDIFLLKQFACLPSEYIEFKTLIEIIDMTGNKDKSFYAEMLEDLYEKGWLLKNEKSYKMHQIVSIVIEHHKIQFEEVRELLINVTKNLFFDQNKEVITDKVKWITFGNSLLKILEKENEEKLSLLYTNLGIVLLELCDYEKSKILLEKAMYIDEKILGETDSQTARSYSNLAVALEKSGDNKGAKILLEKAVKSDEINFGRTHVRTAIKYSNLAQVLQKLGSYKDAKTLLEKSMQIVESYFGKEHTHTARSYSNLALLLNYLEEHKEAKILMEKAIKIEEINLEENHPTLAISYSNLALVLEELGDFKGAKTLLEKAVKLDELNFGKEHPYTAKRYSNFALVLLKLGECEEAKILLEKAIKIDEIYFGEEHESTVIKYSNLAMVLEELGDYEGAKKLLEKVVEADIKNHRENLPSTAINCSNLSMVLKKLGDFNGAKKLLKKVIKIDEKSFGKEHPITARSYLELALILERLGDYNEAKKFMSKSKSIIKNR